MDLTPHFLSISSKGQNPVKANWDRFNPTKAAKQSFREGTILLWPSALAPAWQPALAWPS